MKSFSCCKTAFIAKKEDVILMTVQHSVGQIKIGTSVKSIIQLLLPYKVVLHNDDFHFIHEVVEALVRSVPVSTQEARVITLTAHFEGYAVVITCNKEEAEYYKERLGAYRLTVSIEPV
jgi:ATP-dependent Clp protease adapter protein ClpS